MLKKIYFTNKPLFLIDKVTKDIEDYLHHDDTVFIDDYNSHTVKAMIHEMDSQKIHAGVFLHNNVDEVLNTFKKKLLCIKASGGLVHTDEDNLLLIFRKGKWDLPKGKLDDKEDFETCAICEIKEETGLENVQLEKPLTITYHTYHEGGKHIIKESHWFLMKSEKQKVLIPQVKEDIEKCEWVEINKLAPYLENSHASIVDVVKEGIKVLHEAKNV